MARAAALLGRRCVLVLTLFLLTLYLPLAVMEARQTPLSHDEIFTARIASAPNLPRLVHLSREIDMHPPLHYLVQRLALRLPIDRNLGSRLPSIVAALLAVAALFAFTARHLGTLAAFVAVTVFWFGPLPEYAWQNRPYMLWYALLASLMLAWSRAADRSRSRSRLLPVTVAVLALLLSLTHLFGLACLVPFVLAEVVRARRSGRLDWPLFAALSAPLLLVALASFQLRSMAAHTFAPVNLPNPGLLGRIYFHTVDDLVLVFGACALALAVVTRQGRESPARVTQSRPTRNFPLTFSPGRALSPEVLTLLTALLLLPVPLMMAGSLVGIQFWDRYGFFVVLPLSVLLARLIQRLAGRNAGSFAVLAAAALFGGALARFVTDRPISAASAAAGRQPGLPPLQLAQLDPALPIVAASSLTFVEMSDREPGAIASRVWYLTDHASALRFSGDTLFDNEEKIRRALNLPSHTAALAPFLDAHPRFLLVANFTDTEQWLPRALAAGGLRLEYQGKFASTFAEDDLYLVTQPVRRRTDTLP